MQALFNGPHGSVLSNASRAQSVTGCPTSTSGALHMQLSVGRWPSARSVYPQQCSCCEMQPDLCTSRPAARGILSHVYWGIEQTPVMSLPHLFWMRPLHSHPSEIPCTPHQLQFICSSCDIAAEHPHRCYSSVSLGLLCHIALIMIDSFSMVCILISEAETPSGAF